jgi:hypothetical protein
VRIIVDTREQALSPRQSPLWAEVEAEGLTVGDYSLAGLTDRVAVERRAFLTWWPALAGAGAVRARVAAGRCPGLLHVVVEAPWSDLAQGKYRSAINPTRMSKHPGVYGPLSHPLHVRWEQGRSGICNVGLSPAVS